MINNDVIIVEENSTCELECEVLAGLPPVRLTWLISIPGSSKFEVIENLPEQIVKEGTDCRPKVIQRVQLLVTQDNSGSMFRCQVDSGMSDVMTEELYDVVQVKIPGKLLHVKIYAKLEDSIIWLLVCSTLITNKATVYPMICF